MQIDRYGNASNIEVSDEISMHLWRFWMFGYLLQNELSEGGKKVIAGDYQFVVAYPEMGVFNPDGTVEIWSPMGYFEIEALIKKGWSVEGSNRIVENYNEALERIINLHEEGNR